MSTEYMRALDDLDPVDRNRVLVRGDAVMTLDVGSLTRDCVFEYLFGDRRHDAKRYRLYLSMCVMALGVAHVVFTALEEQGRGVSHVHCCIWN